MLRLLADPPANKVVPGLVGSLVVLVLIIAVVLLLRSMLKQFRKVDEGRRRAEAEERGDAGRPPHDG